MKDLNVALMASASVHACDTHNSADLLSTISVGAALSLDYNARGGEVVPVIIARGYI